VKGEGEFRGTWGKSKGKYHGKGKGKSGKEDRDGDQRHHGEGGYFGDKGSGGKGHQRKGGDWTCPNPEGRGFQFARNSECRLCGTLKPPGLWGPGDERSPSGQRPAGSGAPPAERTQCMWGMNCFRKNCRYQHPSDWEPGAAGRKRMIAAEYRLLAEARTGAPLAWGPRPPAEQPWGKGSAAAASWDQGQEPPQRRRSNRSSRDGRDRDPGRMDARSSDPGLRRERSRQSHGPRAGPRRVPPRGAARLHPPAQRRASSRG